VSRDTDEEAVLEAPPDAYLEMEFSQSEAPTPTDFGARGSCWKCLRLIPVQIVAPPPGSSHEALRFTTCIVSAAGDWRFCGVHQVIRGVPELYIGPERRKAKLPPPGGTDRRLLHPRKDNE